jgi:hypothetical protein
MSDYMDVCVGYKAMKNEDEEVVVKKSDGNDDVDFGDVVVGEVVLIVPKDFASRLESILNMETVDRVLIHDYHCVETQYVLLEMVDCDLNLALVKKNMECEVEDSVMRICSLKGYYDNAEEVLEEERSTKTIAILVWNRYLKILLFSENKNTNC